MKMLKMIFMFLIMLVALTACTAPQIQVIEDTPQANIPNPASVYCTQNGNKLEIRNAADGSQNGVCIFPDGSTCDEWAYFKGECGQTIQKSPTPSMEIEVTSAPDDGDSGMNNASGGYMPPGTSEVIADWMGIHPEYGSWCTV